MMNMYYRQTFKKTFKSLHSKYTTCNKPEAEMESMVCYHLYWLITGSNNVWTVDKNSQDNEKFTEFELNP